MCAASLLDGKCRGKWRRGVGDDGPPMGGCFKKKFSCDSGVGSPDLEIDRRLISQRGEKTFFGFFTSYGKLSQSHYHMGLRIHKAVGRTREDTRDNQRGHLDTKTGPE